MLARVISRVACLLLLAITCRPELRFRDVTGIVTDLKGNALPNAAVQLENRPYLSIRSYIPGADGRYRFMRVNREIDYTLRAKYRTLWSKEKTLSSFDTSAHLEFRLVIPTD